MTISDERLAEMIESHKNYVAGAGKNSPYAEVLSVLSELQAARELLTTLAAQWSGEIGSTKRSDCMAVLVRAHLRNHGQAHD